MKSLELARWLEAFEMFWSRLEAYLETLLDDLGTEDDIVLVEAGIVIAYAEDLLKGFQERPEETDEGLIIGEMLYHLNLLIDALENNQPEYVQRHRVLMLYLKHAIEKLYRLANLI